MIENMNGHKTPAGSYPLATIGTASLTRKPYKPGYYSWEFITRPDNGGGVFELTKPLPVTSLKIKGKTWMVDDPLHWYGMKEYVSCVIPGRPILLVGLGLGLAVWHTVETKASKIIVLDICQDVIDLISPNLPTDSRIEIIPGNFYDPDTTRALSDKVGDGVVLWDLAVGPKSEAGPHVLRGIQHLYKYFPEARRMTFGAKLGKSIIF